MPAATRAPTLYVNPVQSFPEEMPAGARPGWNCRGLGAALAVLSSLKDTPMSGRIKALILLALALIRTLWRLAWHRHIDGLARFRQNYAEDGLTSISDEERSQMRHFGGCIACGRCDRGDAPRVLASKGTFRGTMGLVLAASRSMPDYRAAARGFAHLTEAELERKELLCPTRVPLRELARFVQANAAAARISAPAAQGAKRIPSSIPPSDERRSNPAAR